MSYTEVYGVKDINNFELEEILSLGNSHLSILTVLRYLAEKYDYFYFDSRKQNELFNNRKLEDGDEYLCPYMYTNMMFDKEELKKVVESTKNCIKGGYEGHLQDVINTLESEAGNYQYFVIHSDLNELFDEKEKMYVMKDYMKERGYKV